MEGSMVQATKGRLLIVLAIGLALLFFLLILSWSIGAVDISFTTVLKDLWAIITNMGPEPGDWEQSVVWSRVVRSVAVIGVGIGLSVSGAVMQALIRNPLVDPYITGVSSGAALGAILSILAGVSIVSAAELATPAAALIGALAAFFITMALAESAGGKSINFVLSGMIVGIALSSFTTLIITSAEDSKLHGALFWLYGSFAFTDWIEALMIIVPVLIICAILLLYARELNVILLGDEHAKHLGLDVKLFKRIIIALTSILTAISVAFCGVIGFLGLIVPHTSRMIVGGDHRLLLPTSMVLGAVVLLAADIFARVAMRPDELPVGAVISLIGAPFFIYLMIKRGKEYGG
ncbi:MAG: iron ABC transporter permease [Methanomassiliicoccus sp.]|nr:iron ABC transporter permease [Methanomassiliicoccus sp.]